MRAAGAEGFADQAVHELRIGLVLFFVLSGFLLFRPWVASRLAPAKPGSPRLATYAVHRVGRIIPAYYLAIIGSALLLWPLAGEPGVRLPPIEQLPLFFVFAQNQSAQTVMTLDPPMWTLAVEASFYALLPLLGWLALRAPATRAGPGDRADRAARRGRDLQRAARPAGPAVDTLLQEPSGDGALLRRRHARRGADRGAQARAAASRWRCSPAARRSCWPTRCVHASLVSGSDMALRMRIVRDLPAAAGFAAIVAVAATFAPRALSWRPLAFTGVVSYGLYLWHVPLLLVLRATGLLPDTTLGAALVALPLSLLAGWLSFRFVERPAIAWSRRTKLLGANGERRVSAPARPSAQTAHGRTPTTAPASR